MRINNQTLTLPAQQAGQQQQGKPLQPGDSVKAEVLFVNGDKANIKLDNGAVLRNVQLDGVKLSEGDILTLSVSDMANGQLTMKVEDHARQSGQAAAPSVPEQLSNMGVEPNARNVELATLMMERGVSVTPQALQSAAALMEAHPNLTAEQAVFLAANNIADPKLVEAFESIVSGGALTGGQLMELAGMLEQEASALTGTLTGALPEAAQPSGEADAAANGAANTAQGAPETAATALQAARGQPSPAAPQAEVPQAVIMEELTLVGPGAAKLIESEGLQREAAQAVSEMLQDPAGAAKVAGDFVSAHFSGLPKPEQDALAMALRRAAPLVALAFDAAETTGLSDAHGMLKADPAQIERLLSDIDRVFARFGEGGEGGKALQKLASQLHESLTELRGRVVASDMAGKEALLQKLDQTIAQTRLADGINQYAYVQIPVELNQNRSTAELYVMKRGGKKIDPDDVTVVVALDTQHMGRVESVIKVERKSVSLHAKVEGEGIAAHMRSGSAALHGLLTGIGFKLADFNARMSESPITPLNVEERAEAEYHRPLALDFKI